MPEQLFDILKKRINEEKLLNEVAVRYYEDIFTQERKKSDLKTIIEKYDSLKEVFKSKSENISINKSNEILYDLYVNMENIIYDYFNEKEENTVNELIYKNQQERSKLEQRFKEDFYKYDAYKEKLFNRFLEQNPKDLYNLGKKLLKKELDTKGIFFTEEEFMFNFVKIFNTENLEKRLAKEFYDIIENGSKYRIEYLSNDEEDEEIYNENDGVLKLEGKFNIDNYRNVYEFMYEYTGKRVYSVDEEEDTLPQNAYWTTYDEYFEKIINGIIFNYITKTANYLIKHNNKEYINFAERYGLKKYEIKDYEAILLHCDKINYEISCLREELWTKFIESEAKEVWNKGKLT